MANPPRKKGTGEETAVVNDWIADGFLARRMPAGSLYDIAIPVDARSAGVLEVLTMRADRGERLAVIRHQDLRTLLAGGKPRAVHEEVKRYRSLAVWTIFRKKFVR